MQQLTSAQTIAKYKTLRIFYARTKLTATQTAQLMQLLNAVVKHNTLNFNSYALANLQKHLTTFANVQQLNAQQYNTLLLAHDTVEREQLYIYCLHFLNKRTLHKINSAQCASLIDMY